MTSLTKVTRFAFLSVAILFMSRGHVVAGASTRPDCALVCTVDTTCDTLCGPGGPTCGDYGVCEGPCDGTCGPATDCLAGCSPDFECGDYNGGQANSECYGTCGDGVCSSPYENSQNCPQDCAAQTPRS
jgi:hypothetical protein